MIVEVIPVGMLQANCYVLGCERTQQGIVIDPGDEASVILRAAERHGLRLERIIATHAHFDHVLACQELRERTGAAFYLHPADRPILAAMRRTCSAWLGFDPGDAPGVDGDLIPGQNIQVGDISLEIRHTPGHSPGSVSFVDHAGRRVFTGDALFAGSIGRTDLPDGNWQTLLSSIRLQILSLPDDYAVLSGHGPATAVGVERRSNPFLVSGPATFWE